MSLVLHLILLSGLLFLSAFFSSAETAIFSLSKIERRRLQQNHPKLAVWVHKHLDHPRQSLVAILIGNLVVNTLATAAVAFLFFEYFDPRYAGFLLAVFSILLIFICEIIPKSLAVRQNARISVFAALPLHVISFLLTPFRWLVRWATDQVMHFLIPEKKEHSDQISEEELKTLVKIGEEEGVLDRDERRMIQKLLDLGEHAVKDIMTPRTDLAALDLDDPREKHLQLIKKFHFSHFPVYQGSLDNFLGMMPVQEYVLHPEIPLSQIIKQPIFVPEFKRVDDLLTDFRSKNVNFAVCVDEYGGTAGIVTLEDIFEEIFGEFYDEYAKPANPIRPFGAHEFLVEAKIPLDEFNEYFHWELEAKETATLAGYILEKIGEVPEKGKMLDLPSGQIVINDVIRQRLIRNVIVRVKKP